MIGRSMPAANFEMHWEHRKSRKSTWYHCATRPEILKPSGRTCDAPSSMKVHQLAHRADMCKCGFVSYQDPSSGASETPSPMTEATGERLQVRRRVPIADKVKEAVRLRAENRCEDCGHPLAAVKRTHHPAEWADAEVHVWRDYPCRCGRRIVVALVHFGPLRAEMWLTEDRIGRAVNRIVPTFFWDYSRRLEGHYWMNHCPTCGAKQGDSHILEHYIALPPPDGVPPEWDGADVVPLPGFRRLMEPPETEEEDVRWGNVHHLDENPANNAPSNLRMLCVRCHSARHSKDPESPLASSGSGKK